MCKLTSPDPTTCVTYDVLAITLTSLYTVWREGSMKLLQHRYCLRDGLHRAKAKADECSSAEALLRDMDSEEETGDVSVKGW